MPSQASDLRRFAAGVGEAASPAHDDPDMLSLHAPDTTFTFVSLNAGAVMGYEPEELLGRTPYDFCHPEDLPRLAEAHEAVLAGQDVVTLTCRFLRKDRQYTWFETTAFHVQEPETGEPAEIFASTRTAGPPRDTAT